MVWSDFDDGFPDSEDEDAAAADDDVNEAGEASEAGTTRPERSRGGVTAAGAIVETVATGEWEATAAQQLMDENNREHCLICYDDMALDDPDQAFAAGTGLSKACRCKYPAHTACVRGWVARNNGGCLICRAQITTRNCDASEPNARRGLATTVTTGRPRNRHQTARARQGQRRGQWGQQTSTHGCGIM